MAEPNFRREAIRAQSIRDAARGQRCTIRFVGICDDDPETTVLAHLHDESFGRGQKADDTSAVFACHACHTALDQHTHGLDDGALYRTLLRALQRTIRRLVIMDVLSLKRDRPMAHSVKPVKPRPPKDKRRPIHSAPGFAPGRKLESRPMRRAKEDAR